MSTQEAQDQQQRLYSTTDAQVWAEEFWKNFGDRLDELAEGTMIGWFANAIENAKAHERRRQQGVGKLDTNTEFRIDDGTRSDEWLAGHEAGYDAGHRAGFAEASWNYGTASS